MNTLCDMSRSVLIVIDLQERLMPVINEGAAVMKRARILAQAAKTLGVPVIGTAQNSSRLGHNAPEIGEFFDRVVEKDDFDACAAPGFLESLPPSRDQLIVTGCEAHVCVLQTALGLLARKREVRLIADAVGSRDPLNKDAALQRAQAAGAQILTSEMVIFEWLRDCHHPSFRQLLGLIK
jgi:nicotinamidase-related amidase